jgi:hypothetical protein
MAFLVRMATFVGCLFIPSVSFAELRCPGGRGAPCPVPNPDNGHFYAFFLEELTWDAARIQAESYTFAGVRGHLATITSAQEQEFLIDNGWSPTASFWLGATDAEIEGEWRWVVGPEAGQLFWNGGVDGAAAAFANWQENAPNDNREFGGQDYARLVGERWNDSESSYRAYGLVEFSVPEPGSAILTAIGFIAAIGAWLRHRKRLSPSPSHL